MATIKKEIEMGLDIKLFLIIDDGIAVMTSNYANQLKGIYFKAKQNGQNVSYDFRRNAMIEKFPGIKAEEIARRIDIDTQTAFKKQKETIKNKNKIPKYPK